MSRKQDDALFSAHAILAALKGSIRVLRWGMLALVVVYLASGITVVKPSDVGLIVRFGRVLPQIHQPGLLFALPEPVDEVVMVSAKSVQELALDAWAPAHWASVREAPRSLNPISSPYTLTGDANIIQARFTVRYQVSDPIAYAFSVKDHGDLCEAICYQAATTTLAGTTVDDVLTTKRDSVDRLSLDRAQAEMDRLRLGIHLLAFETRDINPPAQVLPAFQDVVSARVQARTLVEPAKTHRASAIPKAKSQAFALQQAAEAERGQAVARATGRSTSFLAILKEFRAQPELVEARLYTDAIATALPRVHISTVVPSGDGRVRLLLAPQTENQDMGADGETPNDSSMGESGDDAIPAVLDDETNTPLPQSDDNQ
jgi:membrane protease subunit HflK